MTVFSSISATDLDNGNNKLVKYSIATADDSQFRQDGVFTMTSEDSGIVVLSKPLDYEAMVNQVGSASLTVYGMNITATDNPQEVLPKSSWAYLNITITDGDDLGPVFIYDSCPTSQYKPCVRPKYYDTIVNGTTTPPNEFLQVLPVPRLSNPNQTVPIIVRDGDSLNASVQCSITYTTPQGFEDNLEIITENVSGHEYQCNVRVISPFNRDIVPFLDIVILATEQKTRNNYSEEAVLRLVIIPNNQNPPTLTTTSGSFEGYILENSAVGTLVSNDTGLRGPLRLLVTDRDVAPDDPPGNYEITLDPFNGFHVDDSGYIQFREGTLDYETKRIYILNATVRELDTVERLTGSATLTIHVLDVNVPSVPSDLLRVTVPERDYSGVGQFLVSLNASEIEGGDSSQLNYTIIDVYPDGLAGMFRINASGGVFLQGAVSAGDSFTLQTEVSGLGHTDQTASVAVIVDVTPDGNQPPKFTANNYTIYVSEAVPVQSSLWNIPATDPEGDDLTYTITSSDPMNDFNTLNHILRNTVNLDRERVERYIVVLRAEDTGGNSATATVTVIVLDVNDNSPMFSPTKYNFTIDENQNSGTVVGSVMANDTDKASTPFSNVSYSIEPENNDFNVNSESGQITSLRPFDYEKDKIFTFTVLATDGGGNIGVARVIVRVRDLQDNIPVFDRNYTFYVDEGVSGAIVGQVTATDMDTTDNIQYQFDSGEYGNFSINGTTGEIRTIQALDYNVKNQYIFTVTTSDGSAIDPSSSSTVTVIVNHI
ncbi:cadherin-99C-like [Littorina saxatilis]|uniref:cadherin-99C-like n=1 Tax=Littorina saxatilis TaxID=31220 RepID=UPI0038B48A60